MLSGTCRKTPSLSEVCLTIDQWASGSGCLCNNSRGTILQYLKFIYEAVTDVIPYNAAIIKIRLDNRLINTSQIGRRDIGLNLSDDAYTRRYTSTNTSNVRFPCQEFINFNSQTFSGTGTGIVL